MALRQARLFDGTVPGGHDRPAVPDEETEPLLAYLNGAPIVLAARGFDQDVIDPAGPANVPMTYHTDGNWIWPGAVGYYLRVHGVPPEPELVEHIRARRFQVPEVREETRTAAVSVIIGAPAPASPAVPAEIPAADRGGPIKPLPGEPPMTLYRHLWETTLPVGTEIDRIGGPEGNVTYAAGTDWSNRSLPPDWMDRPRHVYRVQRPVRVLTGTAIPWFDGPGGGTAHILPASIEALLADGTLVESGP